ncbi:MAG: hypothetical protein ACE5MM_03215 [Nitrospiraceae bacterium]
MILKRWLIVLAFALSLGVLAHAQKAPSEKALGVPIYPKATFIDSFTAGPVVRYLYASNDLSISVARFYEAKTGKKPERIQDPDGMDTYRFVLKGGKGAAVPELEVRVNHFPGGSIIPDERGQTRRYRTTILISRGNKAR